MNKSITRIAATLHIAGLNFRDTLKSKHAQLREDRERGSLTLEQIIWTVAIAVIAIAVAAIVVAAINSKAAELPGG